MNKKTLIHKVSLTTLLASLSMIGSQASHAEEEGSFFLEEIVVTAQRRAENLSRVPIAVSAFSGDDLKKASITELSDIAGLAPGLYLSSYTTLSPQIFIRGIGSNDDGITAEGAVGVYMDDVYVGRASSAMFDLYDLERIEVLRGPQGTLYGRNTNGGAINIITKKPSDILEGGITLEYGNFDQFSAKGYVSGPLVEGKAAGKISGSYKKRDGWTLNTVDGSRVNDENSTSLRGQLALTPSESVNIVLSMDYSSDDTTSSYKEVIFGSFFGFAAPETPDRFSSAYNNTDAFVKRDIFGASIKVNWDHENFSLTSISGYRNTDIHYTEDFDSTELQIADLETTQEAEQFSQEIRLSSASDGELSWVAGLFYLRDKGRATDLIDLGEFIIGFPDEVTESETQTDSYAAYGELSYQVTDKFKATVGLRYTYEEKSFQVERFNPAASVALLGGFQTILLPQITSTADFSDISPRLVLNYQLNDDMLLYASVTKGFKGGGFNNFPFDTATAQIPFEAEKITSYEAGFKSKFADSRVRLNTSVFYYDYTDLQVRTNVPSGALALPQIRNAAAAKVYGGEVEMNALLTEELSIDLSYAFLHATYTNFVGDAGIGGGINADFSGKFLSRAPKNTLSAVIEYDREVPSLNGQISVRADARYSSTVFFTPANSDVLSQGGYTLLNARIAYENENGWTIALYGKNLTDKTYVAHAIDLLQFNLVTAEIGAPRQYGISASFNF
ncbi:MAG: TonB-dependent receptor [Emcibacter sp.]|nr:TonB-dependent receptor [Emcibacter sp.]